MKLGIYTRLSSQKKKIVKLYRANAIKKYHSKILKLHTSKKIYKEIVAILRISYTTVSYRFKKLEALNAYSFKI